MKPASLLLLVGVLVIAGAVGAFFLFVDNDPDPRTLPTTETSEEVASSLSTADPSLAAAGTQDGQTPEAPEGTRRAVEDPKKKTRPAKAPREPKGPFLRGRIVGPAGQPVSGARVRESQGLNAGPFGVSVNSGPGAGAGAKKKGEVESDALGDFSLPRGRRAAGEISLEVRARGYQVAREVRELYREEGDEELETIVLQAGVVLGGTVVDAEGQPVSGARVRNTDEINPLLDGITERTAAYGNIDRPDEIKTDEEGRFELPHQAPGEYSLQVRHEDYPDATFEGIGPPAGREDSELVLRLAPTATIEGVVLDFPTGRGNVSVQARLVEEQEGEGEAAIEELLGGMLGGGQSGEVQDGGSFRITGLDPGRRYEVQAFARSLLGQVACSDQHTAKAPSSDVELTWNPGASVSFEVRDAQTGKALDDVVVRHRWNEGFANGIPDTVKKEEFPKGKVRLQELRPSTDTGNLDLLVTAPGYLEYRREGLPVPAERQIELPPVGLRRAPLLRVRIVDGESGAPISRAHLALAPESEEQEELGVSEEGMGFFSLVSRPSTGRTDKQGWCELPACSTETAKLSVRKSGFANYVREGMLMPRTGDVEEVISLFEGSKVEVHVIDSQGRSVAGAGVRHLKPDGTQGTRQTDKKGRVRFKNLAPGEHAFRPTEISSIRGASVNVSISVGGDGQVRGAVDPGDEGWERLVVANGSSSELVLNVPSKASLLGRVTAGGEAVSRASLSILPGSESSTQEEIMAQLQEQGMGMGGILSPDKTDSAGRYELSELSIGKHRLRVVHEDLAVPFVVPVEIREGENVLDVELPTTAIEGHVRDADGRPLEGVSLRLRKMSGDAKAQAEAMEKIAAMREIFGASPTGAVTSGPDGAFTLSGVPADTPVVIEAEAAGWAAGYSKVVELSEGQEKKRVDVQLARGGSIRVDVLGQTGNFTFVAVRFAGEAVPRPAPKMALVRDGRAVFRDLAPGSWRVALENHAHQEGDEGGELVEVKAEATTGVTLSP